MTHPLSPQARPATASDLPPSRALRVAMAASLLLGGFAPGQLSWAASTDISNSPLINATVSVKPNLMFILDNSGSMASDYLPDDTGDRGAYSVWSSQCNGAAFNPSAATSPYALPKTADGRNYPNQPLTAAWSDGFQPTLSSSASVTKSLNTDTPDPDATTPVVLTDTITTNGVSLAVNDLVAVHESGDDTHWMVGKVVDKDLVSLFTFPYTYKYTITFTFSSVRKGTVSNWVLGKLRTTNLSATGNNPATHYYYNYTGTQTPQSWAYDSAGNFDTGSTFVNECLSNIGSGAGSSKFSQVLISSLSAADQQRYANWYAYYRTRILMMRSAAGRAMFALDNRYRVGFTTINKNSNYNTDTTPNLGSFANIADFGADQKTLFFSNLYGAPVGGSTPLRRALAKVGRYYGNKFTGQTDPIQNACQRNYSILTTDGYWNESTLPTQLDGSTAVGNQDADINATPRPQYDDSTNYTATYVRTSYRAGNTTGCSNGKRNYTPYTEQQVMTVTPTGTTYTNWVTLQDPSGATVSCKSSQPNATTVESASNGGPAPNTLADVAAYYYNTDLRTDLVNSVPYSDTDPNRKQHMTTYTLGLGLSGRLRYDVNYLTGASSDFNDIKSGARKWPIPPLDTSSDPAKIDDLWHAAVNGHGRYFSAGSADALVSALSTALSDITARDGAGASAASTSLRPVLGTDQVFIASYRTQSWNGELEARTITVNTATDTVSIGTENSNWKASTLLDGQAYSSRTIYYARKTTSGSTTSQSLGNFTYTNLSSDVDGGLLTGYFNNYCSQSPRPTQCSALTSTQQTNASGAALVNFIRGDRSNEGTLYRSRRSVLGDMVDASPVYVGKPPFSYTNNGYTTYQTNNASRCPIVYAAANDGMLHAFSAKSGNSATSCPTAGSEVWAYIPRAVMPSLYMLGDSDYGNQHRFSVNATPVVADIHRVVEGENVWRTMLVGGLGAGGKSYYALDVSSPSSPTLMWEFTDADLGLSYGNPVITQVPDGTGARVWAVVFASGINNSGNGYLYVLNAHTGAVMHKVPTLVNNAAVGSSSNPSGLTKLNAWISTPSDNEAVRFYAGDLLGNLWRFDANNLAAPTGTTADTRAVRLAQFVKDGTAQPITVKPELAEVRYGGYNYPVVLVGTGRYLGATDAMDTTTPGSIYAVKDPLTSTGWSNIRSSMVAQTLTTSGNNRTVTKNAVDWSSSTVAGWYIDLPDAGERVAVGMSLAYTTLTVASIVPATDVCSGSGYSWLYDLDIATGSYVLEQASTQLAGYKRSVATMGINTLQFEGRSKSGQIITNADGSTEVRDHVKAPTSTGTMRRTSWRELTQ
ncbi:PilC/PilY family type IV pilus protein [Aquabacterium sp.]|uniref:pilus assembly protein n=1 Tax=Aquabacterium sp. TaxID=1872578 RepID=UPI0025BFC755|nr:PilC/PilY family type IV pilus protein [Aquabacterium sp.]